MRKVIKILVKTFSVVILTVLGLLLATAIALEIPAVQNFIVDKATTFLSAKLGTRVAIDHVHLKLISRAQLEGVYIEDLHGDTLAYIKKLDVGIRSLGLKGGAVKLGDVKLDGTRFYMHQIDMHRTDTTTSNLGELLARLRSNKPKKKGGSFTLTAASVEITDLKYRYRKLQPQHRDYGVNFQNVDVDLRAIKVEKLSVVNDSIAMQIDKIDIGERNSGFNVNDFRASFFSVSNKGMSFRDLYILTPESEVSMKRLDMVSESWKSYSDFIHKVHVDGSIENSKVSYATIAYFAPTLRDWKSVYTGITGSVSGTVSDMSGTMQSVRALSTHLGGVRFSLKGIPNIPNTVFKIDVDTLVTSGHDAAWLAADITRKPLPGKTLQMLDKLSNISLSGHFDGTLSNFNARGKLNTSQGAADIDLAVSPGEKGRIAFTGQLDVNQLNLGALLDNKSLGRASVDGKMQGSMGAGGLLLNADAKVGMLEFNGYAYHGMAMQGKVQNRNFEGKINSQDPNMLFDFDGMLDFNDSIPHYDFDLRLGRADLHKLHINKRDSVAILSCHVTAKGSGNSLDNANGYADISDLLYVMPDDSVRTGAIHLLAMNNSSGKLLSLQSALADIQLQSKLGYNDLFTFLSGTLMHYIPTLGSDHKASTEQLPTTAQAGDYFLLKLKIKEADNLAQIFLPGLVVARNTDMTFMLNPKSEKVTLTLNSEYIEWNRFFISNLSLNSQNQGDSLSVYLRASDFYVSGFYMPEFSLIGGIKDDRVTVATRFADTTANMSALIGAQALFSVLPDGGRRVTMRLNPSYFTNKDQTWRLNSNDVVWDPARLSIDRLRIVSRNGELTADGVMSASKEDTLRVRLSNFNLAPLSQFTSRRGYNVSGATSGYAYLVSGMKDGMVFSNIAFDSVRVNNVALPPLLFDARWDFGQERAHMALTNRAAGDTLARFSYRPSDKGYMGDVNLHAVDLSLIDPLLKGIIHNTNGNADVKVHVTERDGAPKINGTVSVPSLTTTVNFTNVPYTLTNGEIVIQDNAFKLKQTQLHDAEGNAAQFDASFLLSGRDFSNYSFTLAVKPKDMLVLGTSPSDNPLFNGKIHASGAATIRGDKRGVSLNIAATTSANSIFRMSLNEKSGMADADFISFVPPASIKVDSSYYEIRKRNMISGVTGAAAKQVGSMAINMALTVLPNTEFQLVIDPSMGKGIKAKGNGAMNITLNPRTGDFLMYGDYELTEGSYNLNLEKIVDRTFTIEPGSIIRWTGDPVDAMLNVTASYSVKASLGTLTGPSSPYANVNTTANCKVILTDRLSKPTIDFKVDIADTSPEIQNIVSNALNTPELMSTQFLYLVAMKQFYSPASDISGISSSFGTSTALDMALGQLNNLLQFKRMSFGVGIRPGDNENSQEYHVDMQMNLANNRVFIDVDGNYDVDGTANSTNPNASNLTGDFAVRYYIDHTGNFQTKVFSRTINSYDENQGLQETGLGIYYHEDFDTAADIVRNVRSRFSNWGKRGKKKAAATQVKPAPSTIQSDSTQKIVPKDNAETEQQK